MRPVLRICTTVAGFAIALGAAYVSAADAGTAKTVHGDVRVERGADRLSLSVGDRVREGDRIVVAEGGSAGITLQDETLISIGPGSSMLLERFAFNSRTQDGSFTAAVLRGSLRFVTGLIGRGRPDNMAVRTRAVTIGVRGTDFIVEVPDGE